ncbi:MAG: recombination mediator RecR [candidate division Zixibacteria bacterium]|nr:recombination mediator RecR [candidate division Zixibacteria bacterium]
MFKSALSVEKLVNRLARMPGIGRKSATRLAFHIMKLSREEAYELADTIREVKDRVGLCSVCNNISETDPCHICSDPNRRTDIICVVEETSDAAAMEKVEAFTGLYHILGGRLSPLDGIGPDDLKIKELLQRLDKGVEEVIIATNPNVEGEATAIYLSKLIKPMGVRVTRIARGLPVGSDLEFADSATLTRALEGRQEF